MEAIKKKMQSMKTEKDNAQDKVDAQEAQAKSASLRETKCNEEIHGLKSQLQKLESEFAVIQETLTKVTTTLEGKEKALIAAELQVNQLAKRVQQVEETFEVTETKLNTTLASIVTTQQNWEDSERMRKLLENRNVTDDERMKILEAQLKEATGLADEADRKCGEVAQNQAMTEMELEMAEDRANASDMKLIELEEELKVVGNNLRSLEVSEEQARQTEVEFKATIKNLTSKMKQAEARAEFAERSVQRLLKEVDRVEDELKNEQEKFKAITTELEVTFSEMTGM